MQQLWEMEAKAAALAVRRVAVAVVTLVAISAVRQVFGAKVAQFASLTGLSPTRQHRH